MLLRELAVAIVIDRRKLVAYALDPEAPRGRYKALVFEHTLGYTLDNWQHLLVQLEMLAPDAEVRPHSVDAYGHRYAADLLITGVNGRQAIVCTGWIVSTQKDVVRLVTLWVKE